MRQVTSLVSRSRRRAGLARLGCALAVWVLGAVPGGTLAAEPAVPALRAAVPVAWPGVIGLTVDATDLDHRVLQVRQRLPVARPGQPLVLHLPRQLPGAHGPFGNATQLAGLRIEAGGRALAWVRDPLDPFQFRVDVPADATVLDLSFQHLSPRRAGPDRITITRRLLGIEWENTLLYPAGQPVSALRVQLALKLPRGWHQASALRGPGGEVAEPDADGWLRFGETSLETLVDAPLFAGPHLQRVALDPPGAGRPVVLNLLADEPDQLAATPAQLDAHRALVRQADALFGHRPFRRYDFLLAQSDEFGGIGLEHHESSENALRPGYFADWDLAIRGRELLPHEYVHTWNGKYRRPADLWTPDYHQPMRTSLLWVYEGLTQYWGHVLAARAGLSTPEQARDRLAWTAAEQDARSGRRWRSLADTQFEPTLGPGRTQEWEDWQRGWDYYDEGLLLWLGVDMRLRELSGDRRSLDDFARRFFGAAHASHPDGSVRVSPYTLDDVVAALEAVQPGGWAAYLQERLTRTGGPAPLDGLRQGGWDLVWDTEESRYARQERGWSGPSGTERPQDLAYSLGLRVTSDGKVEQVFWQSPAFQVGLAPGMTLLAVNDLAYKAERLAQAVQAARDGTPLRLLVRDGDHFLHLQPAWRGGLRYPRLARIEAQPDRLGAVYAPR